MKKATFNIFCVCVLTLGSCNTTKISQSWRDPDTVVSMEKLNKVLVVALLKDETNRRAAEDKMAALLKGKGVASYNYSGADLKNDSEETIREKLRKDGFDGAVTMRLIDVDKDVNYTPGTITTYPTYYRTFGGYYRRGWSYYSTPERYTTTKTFTVETNVYSIKQDKMIWTGLTESTNPSKVSKMTEEISEIIYKKMVKEGFVTK